MGGRREGPRCWSPASSPLWRHDGATSCLVASQDGPRNTLSARPSGLGKGHGSSLSASISHVGWSCPHFSGKPLISTIQGERESQPCTHLLLRQAIDDLGYLVFAAGGRHGQPTAPLAHPAGNQRDTQSGPASLQSGVHGQSCSTDLNPPLPQERRVGSKAGLGEGTGPPTLTQERHNPEAAGSSTSSSLLRCQKEAQPHRSTFKFQLRLCGPVPRFPPCNREIEWHLAQGCWRRHSETL